MNEQDQAIELTDDELENVTGGAFFKLVAAPVIGDFFAGGKGWATNPIIGLMF